MANERKNLEETARVLRSRIQELCERPVDETQRPMQEVAMIALRGELTKVGRQLTLLAA